jgi:ribonuclease VapC
MFVDASAIVAIIVREPDADPLAARLGSARRIHVSAIATYEAILGTARALGIPIDAAESLVDDFLAESQAEIVGIDSEIGRSAISAFQRFGRGRHPAQLNMGDCFAYACARALNVPLLFKGDDFSQTDIVAA